jgi:hypothetical protein
LSELPAPLGVTAPIFVVGAARSGTTLLQSMIGAHPDVALLGELHFFDQIMRLKHTIPEPFDAAAMPRLRQGILKCHAIQFVPDFEPVLDRALEQLAAVPGPTYAALFAQLLAAHGQLSGTTRVGEKTPSNVRYLKELAALFPDARIVHILRDPCDSISSRIRYPFTSSSVIFNTLLWKIEMIYALDFAADREAVADRYLEVRYEDLVTEPREVLTRICRFIGVDFAEAMLAGHRRADQVVKDEPWKEGIAQPVNDRSVGAWRERLTAAQVGLLERVAGDYLTRTGYAPQATVGGLRILVEALRDALGYVPYKLRETWRARRADATGDWIGSDPGKINAMLLRALR